MRDEDEGLLLILFEFEDHMHIERWRFLRSYLRARQTVLLYLSDIRVLLWLTSMRRASRPGSASMFPAGGQCGRHSPYEEVQDSYF